MQITTNDSFANRRALIGRWSTILGFLVLIGGMYISLQQPQPQSSPTWIFFIPWITLFIGIILLNVGKHQSMRYGANPRVDRALTRALKGLDHRHHLYNFIPDSPAEHVLITPQGVVVLEARPFMGEIIHEGSGWKRPLSPAGLFQLFADGGLGNPTAEAQRDAEAVQKVLRERLGDEIGGSIMVLPIIVMTNPRVKLQMTNPAVPVVMLADVKGAIRQLRDGQRLTADVQKQLVRALQWETPQNALSTTRSNT